MNEHHTRFKDCDWYSTNYKEVSIGGVGGIGSWLSFFLARIGVPIEAYDDDTVDYTNMGGQMFSPQQVGQKKTEAMYFNAKYFSGYDVKFKQMGRFVEGKKVNPICFSCFDNMEVRREMFLNWKEKHVLKRSLTTPAAFVDGRMSVESYQVFIVQPTLESCDAYEKELFSSDSVPNPLCSMKATSHIGAEIGSKMTQAFTNIVTNHNLGMELRETPFKTSYEAIFMDNINYM